MNDIDTQVERAYKYLESGGVILYPTDTIWGIGCDATDPKAIEKIKAIKGRSQDKSFIVLLPSWESISWYVKNISPQLKWVYNQFTRPTTIVFDQAINLPAELLNQDSSVAIRIPQDDFCIKLLDKLGKPIVSTSANTSWSPSPQNFSEIETSIINKVDHVVDYKRDDMTTHTPSRIIKVDDNGDIVVIRD